MRGPLRMLIRACDAFFRSSAPLPAAGGWPDWFQLGDPHENYYEGSVLYDDLRLEVWRD